MFAGASNIGGCNEHRDEDTLSVSLLNTTANSSRKNWTRLYNLFLVVGSRIKSGREELSIEEDGSVPKSSSNSGSADCCTIDMVPTEIKEFFIEEDGSVPKSSSTSGSADCSTNDMFAPKIEVFPKEDGSVPICFDENTVVACKEVMGSIVGALKEEEVGCKLMSKDELATAQVMAHEIGILNPDLRDMAIENKDLHELAATAEGMNKIAVIGSCKLKDKIRILQRLKQEGHVVAFIGGMATNDDLALKAADVGITICECSTKMARENSEIVISSRNSLRSLIRCLKMGKCAYGNVRTFTEIQLTATLASLLVTLVTTSILDESPITGIHMLWVNSIIYILGGLMMVMESYGHQELMNNQPARRMKSLLTKTMWRNVAIRAASDACHLLVLQFIGQAILQINKDVVKTMVFNGFILCQVLDLFISTIIIFARNEEVSVSVVRFMCSSHWFLMASGGVMAMQVVVVELLQSLAEYERLNVMQWGFCFIYAAWLCGTGLTVKLIADSASEVLWSSRSSGSLFGYLRLRRSSLRLFVIPFSVCVVASFSYCYVNPDIA
ncbi:hypothetical protein GOBAR_AA08012 [Gossypium barbadense]|uniref:Cation-transporting P-type ATPase C-terminal domain-containing protein n=1 Tax=Gossypium barbadense TaxID=3634 RepID=A0A2P5YAQ2_GOSBA|nr:hypothetical protein GOBAR_AA08012 [Gossypium barbadense]